MTGNQTTFQLCFTPSSCSSQPYTLHIGEDALARQCWWLVIQFAIGGLLVFRASLQLFFGKDFCKRCVEKSDKTTIVKPSLIKSVSSRIKLPERLELFDGVREVVSSLTELSPASEFKLHLKWLGKNCIRTPEAKCIFTSHTRSFVKFRRLNTDPEYENPPGSPLEVERTAATRLFMYLIMMFDCREVWLRSIGWALLVGGVATYLALLNRHVLWVNYEYDTSIDFYEDYIDPTGGAFSRVLSDYRFFPITAVLGLLSFKVMRWRNFIFAAWRVEGRLKDTSLIVGSSVRVASEGAELRALEESLYRVYRYMLAVMALQYKSILPALHNPVEPLKDVMLRCGILTPKEYDQLEPSGSRMRDTALGWIGCEVNEMESAGLLSQRDCTLQAVQSQLAELRGNLMFFHGNNFFPNSNKWIALSTASADLFCALFAVSAPFRLFMPPVNECMPWNQVSDADRLACDLIPDSSIYQPIATFNTLFMLIIFWATMEICHQLEHPFSLNMDTFNIDALITGTEETIFANLRCGLNKSRIVAEDDDQSASTEEQVASAAAPSGEAAAFEVETKPKQARV